MQMEFSVEDLARLSGGLRRAIRDIESELGMGLYEDDEEAVTMEEELSYLRNLEDRINGVVPEVIVREDESIQCPMCEHEGDLLDMYDSQRERFRCAECRFTW